METGWRDGSGADVATIVSPKAIFTAVTVKSAAGKGAARRPERG
jgi:hypothetical protein